MADDWYGGDAATFGDRLEGAREAAGLSQTELAAKLGVRLETLQSWEEDMADPRANKLQMVAGMLNVSLMWLLNGEGAGLDGPPQGVDEAEREREILREIREARAVIKDLDARLERLERRVKAGESQ
ncbi:MULTISPECIES: multiprotein-bridging factor 1 family protein [Thioclava]|uniref:Helix-turn-helix domain-containing protein n=1 Tax=Thioclava litoralis TaxID=3076557 RepID=A0ABZ1DZB0_9RHOB|nr:helix-turn-helix domain-containing protein [Thioclava sp. FTW29]